MTRVLASAVGFVVALLVLGVVCIEAQSGTSQKLVGMWRLVSFIGPDHANRVPSRSIRMAGGPRRLASVDGRHLPQSRFR